MSNPDLTLSHAQDLAAKLARNMHLPAHVVNDCGHLLICDDHDILTWGTDQIVYTVDPEQAFSAQEMGDCAEPPPDDGPGDPLPDEPGWVEPRCCNCDGNHHIQKCAAIRKELFDDVCEIPLANGRGVTIVDRVDYDIVSRFNWYLHSEGYAATKVGKGVTVYMHQFILRNIPTGHVADHANGDKLDNRNANLRTASKRQNALNSQKRIGTISKYRGVTRDVRRNSKWMAYINKDGKKIHLGYFSDDTDAARAYDAAARIHHGEFARLNFPDDALLLAEPVALVLDVEYAPVGWIA